MIDLTSDTVASAADIAEGKIGHLNDGSVATGSLAAFPKITGGCANLFAGKTWEQEEVVIDISGCTKINSGSVVVQLSDFSTMFQDSCGALKKITLDGKGTGIICILDETFETDSYTSRFGTPAKIEEIVLKDVAVNVNKGLSAFSGDSYLKKISGSPFDFSNVNGYDEGHWVGNFFTGCTALEEVSFVSNTILWNSRNIFSPLQSLNDDSIVSIANGLKQGVTSHNTLTFHSTPYARCSVITGTVSLDSTGTYYVFTKDSAGAVTLADFITNTKGWTLASAS